MFRILRERYSKVLNGTYGIPVFRALFRRLFFWMPAVFLAVNEFIDNFNFFVVFTHIVDDRYLMPGSFDVLFRFYGRSLASFANRHKPSPAANFV